MIFAFCGDTHGHLTLMYEQVHAWEVANGRKIDTVFQVGDFGIWPRAEHVDSATQKQHAKSGTDRDVRGDFPRFLSGELSAPVETFFIRGNHEDQEYLIDVCANDRFTGTRPIELCPNLHFLPDGYPFTHHDLRIAGLGGCFSHRSWGQDKAWQDYQGRRKNHILQGMWKRLMQQPAFDILLTHDGPTEIGLQVTGKHQQEGKQSDGCTFIRELIETKVRRFSFSGHWHHRLEAMIGVSQHYSLDKTDPAVDPARSMKVLEID